MPYIVWDDTLDVGVASLNEDHKHLIQFISELHSGMVTGLGISKMTYILDGLIDYTKKHFMREEALMKKHGYPELAVHRQAHIDLMAQVNEYHRRLAGGEVSFTLELMSFLKSWVIDHIHGVDNKYREFFSSKGVS